MPLEQGEGWRPSPALEAAARYIADGLNPIPLKPRDKRPATATWKAQQRAPMLESHTIADLDRYLLSWWDGGDRGVAVLTGSPFGLLVVDVDSPEAGAFVERTCGSWPNTTEVATAKGSHLWFAHPGGAIGNRARVGDVELDVRGDGGYVVAPSSTHPTGHVYAFTNEVRPLPPLPDALTHVLRPPRVKVPRPNGRPIERAKRGYAAAALNAEVDAVRSAPIGARNDVLNVAAFSLARFVVSHEMTASEVATELTVAAIAAGLSERESRRTIASAFDARAAS